MACCCHSLWTQSYYGMFGQESQRSWRDNEGKQLLSDTDCIPPPRRAQKASSMHSGWEIRTRRWLGFNIHLCGKFLSSSVLQIQAKLISLVLIISNSKWVGPWPFMALVSQISAWQSVSDAGLVGSQLLSAGYQSLFESGKLSLCQGNNKNNTFSPNNKVTLRQDSNLFDHVLMAIKLMLAYYLIKGCNLARCLWMLSIIVSRFMILRLEFMFDE